MPERPTTAPLPASPPALSAGGAGSSPILGIGHCYAMFAYDIGLSIDLEHAGRRITEAVEPELIRHKRRIPTSFEFRPTPLRVIQSGTPLLIAGLSTSPRVECVIYDFGAVSVTYTIPLSGPLDGLLSLSDALYENAYLLADSRRRVERLLVAISPSVIKPHIAEFVEDYAVYQIESLVDPAAPTAQLASGDGHGRPQLDAAALVEQHRRTIARILRAEPGDLSPQEVDDALSTRIAYAAGEQVILDWNAAMLIQRDSDDARAVLEYANVELLELRRLDDQLDAVLDRSYAALGHRSWYQTFRLVPGRAIRNIAELQMDSALLFEGVNNALKLIGDQYLARLYRLAAQRLHLPEWDTSILRKLQTAESIYQKLSDQQTTRRMEALEWVIIALIAFEILMSLIR